MKEFKWVLLALGVFFLLFLTIEIESCMVHMARLDCIKMANEPNLCQ